MQYLRPSFTVAASSNQNLSQRRWDYATLPKQKFIEKYGEYTVNDGIDRLYSLVEYAKSWKESLTDPSSG